MYKISVIVPVFNAEKYLNKCLDSLVNQTYENIEIITVNDASTDNSLEILKKYKDKYNNIKVINLLENHRQGGARNIGIQNSTGDYILFVDSDDWIELNACETFIEKVKVNDCDIVCCCNFYREYSNGSTNIINGADVNFFNKIKGHVLLDKEKEQLLFKGPGVWQNLYKADIIKQNNILFPIKLSYEDNYFVPLVFAYVSKVEYIETPFYHYRENLSSTIFKKDNTQLDRIEIEKMRYAEFEKRDLLNKYYDGYEILTLKLYYLITLGTLFKYYEKDFNEKAINLKNVFYGQYPNFKKNPYFKNEISKVDKLKIYSMEISPNLLYFLLKVREMIGVRK